MNLVWKGRTHGKVYVRSLAAHFIHLIQSRKWANKNRLERGLPWNRPNSFEIPRLSPQQRNRQRFLSDGFSLLVTPNHREQRTEDRDKSHEEGISNVEVEARFRILRFIDVHEQEQLRSGLQDGTDE